MGTEENKTAVRSFLNGLAKGEVPDDVVNEDFSAWLTSSGDMPGDRYRGAIKMLASIFTTPLTIEIDSLVAEDDHVVAETTSHGPLLDGEEYRNRYVFVFRFEGGRISHVSEHFDPRVVAEELVPLLRQAARPGAIAH